MSIQYLRTNIVTAWPEARQDIPGYGIEYPDGYRSWCPKEAFEGASIALGKVSFLPAYQQRAIAELAQLDDRIEDLALFLTSGNAIRIAGRAEVERLTLQLEAMELYSAFLRQRVNAFTVPA